jgi:phosphoribosylformylglycinamidine synthase
MLNLDREIALQALVLTAIERGLVRSAHDCAEGGLAVALAECCLSAPAGPLGAEITLAAKGLRRDSLLFGESQSRIILSVKSSDLDVLKALAVESDVSLSVLGIVGGPQLTVSIRDEKGRANVWIDRPCRELDILWRGALRSALESPREAEGRPA